MLEQGDVRRRQVGGRQVGEGLRVLGRPLQRPRGTVAASQEVRAHDGVARRVERPPDAHHWPPPLLNVGAPGQRVEHEDPTVSPRRADVTGYAIAQAHAREPLPARGDELAQRQVAHRGIGRGERRHRAQRRLPRATGRSEAATTSPPASALALATTALSGRRGAARAAAAAIRLYVGSASPPNLAIAGWLTGPPRPWRAAGRLPRCPRPGPDPGRRSGRGRLPVPPRAARAPAWSRSRAAARG